MNFKPIEDLEEAACLIAELNKERYQHIGYCGLQKEEIHHSHANDFSDLPVNQSLMGAFQDSLVGILGLDIDKEDQEAEIWGSFIKSDNWNQIANGLWSSMLTHLPFQIKKFHAFYHMQNQNCTKFFKNLGFQHQNNHLILKALAKQFIFKPDVSIHEITTLFHTPFKNCHNQLFPSTYSNGYDILNQLNENRKLLISEVDGQLQGYIFYTVNPDFHEGKYRVYWSAFGA